MTTEWINRCMRTAGLLCFVLLATLVGAESEVYKWVDKEGNVHYGDVPPEGQEAQRLELEKEPPREPCDAVLTIIEQSEKSSERRAEERRHEAALEHAAEQERLDAEGRCLFFRKQLNALQQKLPVYRDEAGFLRTVAPHDTYEGYRQYLDDATRAREMDRYREKIAATCSDLDDPDAQRLAGRERIKSKRCEAAAAGLEALLRPEARSSRQTIEEARQTVRLYCEETTEQR